MSSLKTILIVDDNIINRQILSRILRDDYNIIEAENGEMALSILREKHEIISVVLLDISMPVLDGYEVLRQMRKDLDLVKIPVIVVIEQIGQESEVRILSLGANDYILKPYKPMTIKNRIANTIYLRETASFVNAVQQDSLTNVYSKDYFYLCADKMIKNNPNKKYDIICCDIERFKLVNDLYGSDAGNDLLKYIAKMLQNSVKEYGICGRIGPDVFACLINHQENYYSNYFSKAIEHINHFNLNLNIVVRYGIYVIEDRDIPVNIMCDRACIAIESIKGKYDTYFSYYDDKVRQKLIDEQFITINMKKALSEKQFEVYFQPKYELKTEKIIGAEALVRWNNPERGFMSPAEFIPLFEKNGFITDLDIYVWETCCRKIREWIDKGNKLVPISVNVSRADIYNPCIDTILLSLIRKYNLSPKYLYLEITETAYTENPDQLIAVIDKLKKLGFIIEMDDFGTGYSSLNMLSELPIDVLKLDMKFIQNQEEKKNSRSILSFIISLAKWLNLRVIAEGVETMEQVNLLRALSCEYSQGFFHAKPMKSSDFEELILSTSNNMNLKYVVEEHNDSTAKNTVNDLKKMLIVDSDLEDFYALKPVFEEQYSVCRTFNVEESIEFIEKFKKEISIMIFPVNEKIIFEDLDTLRNLCNLYDIPIITIHSSTDRIQMALGFGVLDYILRPYIAETLKNRIENAVFRSQITQFEKEKQINTAIIEMKKRAEEDSLTGLLNRAEFESRIQDFFYKNKNPEGIFVILDIDNFKRVNDTLGHIAGDDVLKSVAETINYLFPETSIISRIGGDEFAMFIPYKIDEEQLKAKMEKLCDSMKFDMQNIITSCSIGACFSPEYGADYQQLYNNADIALLTAKRNGKSRYEIFEKGMEIPLIAQLEAKASVLLDDVSDVMFVCDAVSSEIIYINDTACRLIKKERQDCIGARCYQLFWDECKNCDRCFNIDKHTDNYYEEDTLLKDGITKVHIKAKLGEWDNRKVKIHYLQGIEM